MPDLDQLHSLGGELHAPPYDAIVDTARRRRRQATVTLTAACAALVLAIGTAAVVTGDSERSAPDPVITPSPTPSPTPNQEEPFRPESMTSMTPREVVRDDHAELQWAGTSYDDPDVRIALWAAECRWCPKKHPESRSRPHFQALALTTSGFRSEIVYVRPRWGQGLPVTVESPAPDVFLLAHDNDGAGPGWLVDTEGEIRDVRWVSTPIEAANPRQWFRCTSQGDDGATWCTLDPETATAYEWPGWSVYGGGTGNRPDSGEQPWGARDPGNGAAYEAFWQQDGTVQRRVLPPASGRVGDPPGGGPLFFSANTDRSSPGTLDLLYVDGADGWRRVARDAPELDFSYSLTGTPGGALIAVGLHPSLAVWRADDLVSGDFELVFQSGIDSTGSDPELRAVGDRLFIGRGVMTIASEDDGRTWSGATTWR